jgi:LppP/LprE lipoprotein
MHSVRTAHVSSSHAPRLASVLVTALLALAPGSSAAQDNSNWLDQPAPTGWNQPLAPVPTAPTPAEPIDPAWLATNRFSESPEDDRLVQAGWHLDRPYQAGWNVKIISAASGTDGMDRPMGYQFFVFKDGFYAGTLAPVPMDSRSDGALDQAFLTGPDTLTAEFRRYSDTDPLCCPSGTTSVVYELETFPSGASVVNPVSTTTSMAATQTAGE